MKEVMTIKETAAMLGIGLGLCYELARRGDIPAIHLGRRVVVPVQALMAFLGATGNAEASVDMGRVA